jgi:phosphatidylglycerophosphate synthase
MIFAKSTLAIVGLAILSFVLLAVFQKNELSYFKPWGGYANYITGSRFLLISVLAIINLNVTALLLIGVLALVLDVVDGYVARKLDQTSKMGSLFDLEVDAYYVLILSSLIWLNGLLPGWIVVVASLRYIFVLLIRMFNFDYRKDKRTALGPLIAGLHFTVLLLPFVIPWRVYFPLCLSTAILVLLSFLYSLYQVIR